MILLAGAKIKISGTNAAANLDEIEAQLRGHCVRRKSAVVITKTTSAKFKLYPDHPNGSQPPLHAYDIRL